MTTKQGQKMHYTSFIDKREQQLQYAINEYWEEGRWLLEELGEKGMLMLFALTDNTKKFEELWNKHLDDRIDSED